ncbi:MAG: 50S ribosomal protein L29 [Phycisphaerales bacterium]|nr:50S ribosomal protein L29 [Phycisphaerales bacterium]
MDMKEIKKLKDEELSIECTRVRRALFDLRSQVVTEKVKDSSQFVKTRVDLARLLTETSARRVATSPARTPTLRKPVVLKQVARKPVARKPVARKKVKS